MSNAWMNECGCCDVLVIGGGPAGCAAALSAARRQRSVMLVEKEGFLGGAAVSQGVSIILSTNGVDFPSIWHEFMSRLKQMNGIQDDDFVKIEHRYKGTFDPELTKYVWEDLLRSAGVKLLYHAWISEVIVVDHTITGVVATANSGHTLIKASRFIDCTGDGLIAHLAGEGWEIGANGNKYSMAATKVLRLGNISYDTPNLDDLQYAQVAEQWQHAVKSSMYKSPIITSGRIMNYVRNLGWRMPKHRHELILVMTRLLYLDPLDMEAVSEAEFEGRRQALEIADFYKRFVPGCQNSYLLDTNQSLGIRSSRRIHGIETVNEDDVMSFRKYSDGIVRASWDIDIWPADSYTRPAVDHQQLSFRQRDNLLAKGAYFDIRMGCLIARTIGNLLMAGRCISADHIAQASTRIQQTCMATGQVAGLIAAQSLDDDVSPKYVKPSSIKKELDYYRSCVVPAFSILESD